ncbi:lysophospholipid acyltransferase family protein [Vallitalea guaymasensis]|uniref:lysophospholipid acyltransferase family protein n=1 Tax=Vallitalea guaymasensis TaxID=1185412 RepID=UPI000DE20A75|nr:lysophospholipid acyltransferase family protein [Vallitalea guaymasensis]
MRAVIIVIFMAIYLILALPVLIIGFIAGLFSKDTQYKIGKFIVTHICRGIMFLTGSRVNITGLENIPDETVLFVGNHRSIFDVVLLIKVINRPFGFIGKKELTKVPYLNLLLKLMGGLFLDRTNFREGLKIILAGIEMLKSGLSMLIFPEGTRNKESEEPLPFKQGSLKLAEKANVPIVPFGIKGTDNIFENNSGIVVKPSKVTLNFGKPILLSELPQEDMKKSAVYVRSEILQLLSK